MQRARLKRLDRFKATSNAVLVATDVAGRGLDIKGVEFVVNYQVGRSRTAPPATLRNAPMSRRRVLQHGRLQRRALQQVPRSSDDYVHRAGRTARIHHDGQTVRRRSHLVPFPLSLSAAPA